MLIGARQLGLAVIMHDAAHNALSRNHDFNDILSNFFVLIRYLLELKYIVDII